jgi:hypothetical protein
VENDANIQDDGIEGASDSEGGADETGESGSAE